MARTHVILSDELLERIDEVAGKRGRSRFLEEAAREKLARAELSDALEAARGAIKGKEGYEQWRERATTRDWVREVRRERGRP